MLGAAAFRGLFFLPGAGLGIRSGADASAWKTELGTSIHSSTTTKKPLVSTVSGEAQRQCSAPGKVPRPSWGHNGKTGASLKMNITCIVTKMIISLLTPEELAPEDWDQSECFM